MRIAVFTDTYLPEVNGVARSLGRWVAYLEAKKIPVKVFAPTSEHTASKLYSDQSQIERFFSVPFVLYPECRLGIPNPAQIKKTLQAFQPTVIHVATPFNLGLYGIHYAKKHSIPLVASYHTHFDQYLHYYKLQWMEGLLWKYMSWFHQDCRKIYVPSRSTLEHLETKGFQHLDIWGRGVDSTMFHPNYDRGSCLRKHGLDEDRFTYLFVGRLAPEKSVDVLLEAYHKLPDRVRQRTQLVIAGDGPQYKALADKYKEGGDEGVKLLGFVQGQALAELYSAADAFVFPSATETFGNVVLEAMACGTPVIGAAAGGVKDNVQHLRTGLLVPPGDTEGFSAAMERIEDDPHLRERLASSAYDYSKQQAWDRIFDRLRQGIAAVQAPEPDAADAELHKMI